MNAEDRYIRDVVAPIVSGKWSEEGLSYERLEGTAFLVGRRGIAVTAAHVIDQLHGNVHRAALAFVNREAAWVPVKILEAESHPEEDVAVLRLANVPWPSWLEISSVSEHQTGEYQSWGYPIAVAASAARYEQDGLERPDLVFTQGYIRRRISRPLPSGIYRGQSFYELSEQAGHGCSGGPVISKCSLGHAHWRVCGIYIGERDGGFVAAYATRTDAIASWSPAIVGRSLEAESRDL
jgi:hypothetical protein